MGILGATTVSAFSPNLAPSHTRLWPARGRADSSFVSRSSSVYTSCKPTGSFRVVDGDGKQAEIKNANVIVSPASEKVDAWTYVFGKPGELDRDLARLGTSRQRFLRINLTALLFALATNFLGLTSALLSLLPDLQGLYVIPADLTLFFPVKGWKRYTGEGAFELIYPVKWLADQAVVLATQARGVEDRMMTVPRNRNRVSSSVQTAAAFGPPRGDGSENVSVVRSKLGGTLALESLGAPDVAAQRLLDSAIAPEDSGKVSTLCIC